MASKNKFNVQERAIKAKGKTTITYLKKIKTDCTEKEAEIAAEKLKADGCIYFEVTNNDSKEKVVYKKTLSGENYEIQTSKI